MNSRFKSISAVLILFGILAGIPSLSHSDALQGITVPNADVTLSFVVAGRVSKVMVQAGHTVEKDQLLVRLYDEPERIQCQQLKMLSEDRTKIDAAKAELDQKRVDLKKVQQAMAKGAASNWEVEHLNLSVRIAELSLQSAILEQNQYTRRYKHSLSQLERMHLAAPIAGLVEEVSVEVGESIGTLGPVVRIVQNDPLWIDVPVPLVDALELSPGQTALVTFPGTSMTEQATKGRIINMSAVADAASETLRVRVEVPNPQKRPAGERVTVDFSSDKDLDIQEQAVLD